ncbi:g10682 [Coccomyxa viridis]|uniref:G10682 protein n=1 Tax=Coccomyxa viridis TaxID=1274662 RepID=A0ABP1G6A8_9CHLO
MTTQTAPGKASYAEVAAAPPHTAHANERSYGSQKRGGDGNILGFLNVRGLQHFIRLRKFVPINDQLSAELGVDLNVKNQSYFPQAALTYQIQRKDGRKLAVLRATRNAIFLRKTFTLTPPKVDMSFNLHATAGVSYKGQPEFAVDVDNVKPTGLVIGAALIMLALGKPLTGSRAFGGASFALPQMGDCKAMAESKVMAERKGKGLHLSIKQLNAVLRL